MGGRVINVAPDGKVTTYIREYDGDLYD